MTPATPASPRGTAFSVEVLPSGARLVSDGVVVEASGATRDRDVIRAALAVRRGDRLLFRDRVNLTSSRSRETFLTKLNERHRVALGEDVLLALDEGLRQRRCAGGTVEPVGTPDISETPLGSIAEVEARIGQRLLLKDPDAVRVTLAALKAHQLEGDPVWLMIVGPPSGTKTELVTMAHRIPGTVLLSELTSRTFASGLTTGGDDPSLLARLANEVLLFRDFTSILQMHREERQAILAQLREIYDGRYDKSWGTGKQLHWEGRLGFVAGVTPVIDSHHAVVAVLGQRFVFLRLRQPERQAVGRKAIRNTKRDREAREEMAVAGFMASIPVVEPEVSEEQVTTLAQLADFVTRARSGVERDGWRRELDYTPEPEMPGRFAR